MTADARPSANDKNLSLLIQLRWLAVMGQVLTIFIVESWFDIRLPLIEMGWVIVFLVVLNLASLLRRHRGTAVTNTELFLELLLDVTALTAQLYLSGGASNPFISLYLLQVSLGAVLLERWSAWVLVAVASLGFIWLSSSFRPLALLDERNGDLFRLHVDGMFVCFVLAAGLLVLFITRINRNLRASDAHLAALRQQSAEEDHIVRMGLLASGAAHELGTPLATLSVILNDWRRMGVFEAEPDLAEEVAEMQNQLDRCKAIVSGILMSSGEARFEATARTTAATFFDGVVAEWKASRSPPALDYAGAVGEPAVLISDPALQQVLFNLFDNALEASPAWVGIAVRRHEDVIAVEVRDHGPGFSKEMLAAFGTPYRSSKNRPGSGLGLFLVVNVVRKLGGDVTARNEATGACVTLTLPLATLSPERRS